MNLAKVLMSLVASLYDFFFSNYWNYDCTWNIRKKVRLCAKNDFFQALSNQEFSNISFTLICFTRLNFHFFRASS